MSQIFDNNEMMKKLAEKHGDKYFALLGKLILEGMDIQTAIFKCWNDLEANK